MRKKYLPPWLAACWTLPHARRSDVPVRRRSPFGYTIRGLPNFLYLWKVVEAEALTKYPLQSTKSGIYITAAYGNKGKVHWNIYTPETLDKVILYVLNYIMVLGLPMLAVLHDKVHVAPTYLPASCYLPYCLDGASHCPTD